MPVVEDLQRRVRAVLDDIADRGDAYPIDWLRLIDAATDLAAEKAARRVVELREQR